MSSAFAIDDGAAARLERVSQARQLSATALNPISLDRPMPVLTHVADGLDTRPPAESRDPCPRCATRGEIGCLHQAPYVPVEVEREPKSCPRLVRGPTTPEEDREILALDEPGIGFTEIAQRIGRPRSTVWSRLRALKGEG